MKSSEIEEIDQAHKKVMRLWKEKIAALPDKKMRMSYARFKALITVRNGEAFCPEIAEAANLDQTTAADLLLKLLMDGFLERKPISARMNRWDISEKGKRAAAILLVVFEEVNEKSRKIPFGISGELRQ